MRRNWLVVLALLVAIGALLGGIGAGALWEPHEVSVAELARRIGLNLLGGAGLTVPGADNSVPIRADLGRGELPFTSAALGFRLLGLSGWAGRLPLALWAMAGLGTLYAALRVLWDVRVALYACLVLATTPVYFLQARVLLGDAVTLATFIMAWSGLAVGCLGSQLSARARCAFTLLGVLGLYAGFWCRGPILNVAVPALAVGVSALASRPTERFARRLSLGVAVVGVLALALGASGLALATKTGEYSVFVGTALRAVTPLETFEASLGELAHGAFPWSAMAPLVLALVARRRGVGPQVEAALDAAALGLGLGLAAVAWLSAYVGNLVGPAICCFAVLVAVAFREVEKGTLGSPLLGLAVAALAVVIGFDLRTYPDKTLVGLGLGGVTLPVSLHDASSSLWLFSALGLGLAAVLCLGERDPAPEHAAAQPVFRRREYVEVLRSLQGLWNGNLIFALLLLEAGLVGFLLLSAISERLVALPQWDGFGSLTRQLVAAAAIGVPLLPLVPLGAMLLRDLARAVFGARSLKSRLPLVTRGQGLLLAFACVGGIASLGFYPAAARQLAPGQALDRYRELRRGNEPLGIIGERPEAARFQGAPGSQSFDDIEPALVWLTAEPSARRWLVVGKGQFPELNARFRELAQMNLPVLDARSSEVLLASNRNLGEPDENPLSGAVLDVAPPVQHPLHAVLGTQLEVLGWSVQSLSGAFERSVTPGSKYRFSIYFRVLGALSDAWQTFVHLDGLQRRFNADHEPLGGKYPLRLWRQNDVMVDSTELLLEPNFSPGDYRVYFGLFSGDQRLPVTEGPQSEGRVVAGMLQVR